MRPLGLTVKRSNKKYKQLGSGELMLVHICTDCGRVSLNRIAADDDVDCLLEAYERSLGLDRSMRSSLGHSGIQLLNVMDGGSVRRALFGRSEPVGVRLELDPL